MTDGRMWYSVNGKQYKAFGPDDHSALDILRKDIEIVFITADRLGYDISLRRIMDMNYPLYFEPIEGRSTWINRRFGLVETIYMGDSFLDESLLRDVGYGICPADGALQAREAADYVTQCGGGNRAVAEACLHIKEKFFV